MLHSSGYECRVRWVRCCSFFSRCFLEGSCGVYFCRAAMRGNMIKSHEIKVQMQTEYQFENMLTVWLLHGYELENRDPSYERSLCGSVIVLTLQNLRTCEGPFPKKPCKAPSSPNMSWFYSFYHRLKSFKIRF